MSNSFKELSVDFPERLIYCRCFSHMVEPFFPLLRSRHEWFMRSARGGQALHLQEFLLINTVKLGNPRCGTVMCFCVLGICVFHG